MRFSKEDQLQMYQSKDGRVSYTKMQKLYGIDQKKLAYLISAIRNHGVEWLSDLIANAHHKWTSLDNGLMENFFGIMKREMFYGCEKIYRTTEELIPTIPIY